MLKGTVEDLLANRLDVDMKLTSTQNSISIEIVTKEGVPTSYSYQITGPDDYKKEANNLKESTYTFDKLNLNTEYSIKVIVKNKANLTKEITKTIKTELVAEPVLKGMTPVVYKDNNWVVADTSTKWYDYANQEWANAVILNDGITKTAGQGLDLNNDVRAMFVWIPRYEYKIVSDYNIEINFISKDVIYENTNSNGYRMHPAFKFGTEELSGIWVGKFETSADKTSDCYIKGDIELSNSESGSMSSSDNLKIEEAGNSCNNENQEPYILPNVSSLRYQNASNQFKTAQKLNSLISSGSDSHMMKNSEWGAVTYLSQSRYGKYGHDKEEIYINNCSKFITGIAGDEASSAATNNCINTYETEKGQKASTTGNITGIYDMRGGAWDLVMGYYSESYQTKSGLSWGSTSTENYAGFTTAPDVKYYDNYTSAISTEACGGKECWGHALSETSDWCSSGVSFVTLQKPYFVRGSFYNRVNSSIFLYSISDGNMSWVSSFRIVIS